MKLGTVFLAGVVVGVLLTLFTSLLTELVVVIAAGAVIIYFGRKKWKKEDSTPSTEKTYPLP